MSTALVLDVMRRGRAMFALGGAALFAAVWLFRPSLLDSHAAIAASALACSYLTLFMPFALLMTREIAQLPVSRTELWRARCAIAYGLTGVAGVAIKALAVTLRPASWLWPHVPDVMLSTAIDVLYVGSLLGLAALWPASILPWDPKRPNWSKAGAAAMLVAWVSPWLLRRSLPTRWDEVTPPMLGAAALCALLTAAALAHRPAAAARASRRMPPSRRKNSSALPWPDGWFTGIGKLYWLHAGSALFIAPPLIGFASWVMRTMEPAQSGNLREILHAMQLMPFDDAYKFDGAHGLPLFFFLWIGASDRARQLILRARALRILPVTATGWSLRFAVLGVIWTLALWLWLIGIHRVIVGTWPANLRPDLVVLLIGGLALMQGVEAAVGFRGFGRVLSWPIFTVAVLASNLLPLSAGAQCWLIGVAALAAGIALMRRMFIRRESIYKFKPQTFFGMPFPG